MTWDRWWLFAVTVFLISGTPGPNMLHVMTRSVRHGFARSVWAMAGCMSAVLLALVASAAGVGALLLASPHLFDVLRYAGAAYLVWLGFKAWRGAGKVNSPLPEREGAGVGSPGAGVTYSGDEPTPNPSLSGRGTRSPSAFALFRDALFTGLSNPKLILFAAALFPQFISQKAGWAPQFAILTGTFVVIETGWYVAYAAGGRRLAGWLASAKRQRLFDRATGSLFFLFGAGLIAARA
ncbi:LysE family translocator [Sphingomonas oryzagri]|uniref:LysE family translocator n=1 Tax=Sphingomonas oryzagri TaxID=3042314 RepID=A0ABT6N3F6_9SPHN|nr:LysE family translocator [Sphingomonas oryzagri]MDH7639809.1 LysE family translocator [Sphingomonas oryzagri]